MEQKITFNELRKIKDSLPDGAIRQMAKEFEVSVATVRNYFGGANYREGKAVGIHMEPGPNGGIVLLDDTTMLERAKQLIQAEAV
ncbi:DNA-binding protein [uncultured Draconibacterium sp.]|uniref:DNA-binding protein n=1 Tax=uncultured Draconibacterium sp. TaxID=1573823 RepID=UPI003217AE62